MENSDAMGWRQKYPSTDFKVLISVEASLLGLWMATVSSQSLPSVCICVLISSSYKDTIRLNEGPPNDLILA